MWIMTTAGFISAVKHDAATLKVRARDYDSLKTLVDGVLLLTGREVEIEAGGGTDYPYRAYVARGDFAEWLAYEATEFVDYPNFKTELEATRGEIWGKVAGEMWLSLLRVTDEAGIALSPITNRNYWSEVDWNESA